MFEGTEWKNIEKGLKVFDRPVSLDICKAFVKIQSDSILERWKLNHHSDMWFDRSLRVKVLNIRAEDRESRDLLQDLQDIRDGYVISHASDTAKRKKGAEEREKQPGKAEKD